MPTNAVSLLLYVGLLLPGFAFTVARSQHRPIEQRSIFWETTAAVFASVVCDSGILAAALMVSLFVPAVDRTIGQIAASPSTVVAAHPASSLLATLGLLGLASVLGFLLGSRRAQDIAARVLRTTDQGRGSSWHEIFETAQPPGTTGILVEIEFTDGSGLQGLLSTFDRLGTDSGDRGLVLTGTITRRRTGETVFTEVPGFSTVAVTDRNIRVLAATYLDEPWPPDGPRET